MIQVFEANLNGPEAHDRALVLVALKYLETELAF
jgi:hypothetical protein